MIVVADRMPRQQLFVQHQNGGQYIIEIMSNTAGKLPNGLHPRCCGDLSFDPQLLADIAHRYDG